MPHKDKRGILRGSCSCGKCDDYVPQAEGHVCGYCGCHPVKHTDLRSLLDMGPDEQIGTPESIQQRHKHTHSSHSYEDRLPDITYVRRNRKVWRSESDKQSVDSHKPSESHTSKRPSSSNDGKIGHTDDSSRPRTPTKKASYPEDAQITHSRGSVMKNGKKSRSPRTSPAIAKKVKKMPQVTPCQLLHRHHLPYHSRPDDKVKGVYKIAFDKKTIYVGKAFKLKIQMKRHFTGTPHQAIAAFIKSLSEEQKTRLTVFWLDSDKYKHDCGGKTYFQCITAIQGRKPTFSYSTQYTEAKKPSTEISKCQNKTTAASTVNSTRCASQQQVHINSSVQQSREIEHTEQFTFSDQGQRRDCRGDNGLHSEQKTKICKIYTTHFKRRKSHQQRTESGLQLENKTSDKPENHIFKESSKIAGLKNVVESYKPGQTTIYDNTSMKLAGQKCNTISVPITDTETYKCETAEVYPLSSSFNKPRESYVQKISTTVVSTKSSSGAGKSEIKQTFKKTTSYKNVNSSPETPITKSGGRKGHSQPEDESLAGKKKHKDGRSSEGNSYHNDISQGVTKQEADSSYVPQAGRGNYRRYQEERNKLSLSDELDDDLKSADSGDSEKLVMDIPPFPSSPAESEKSYWKGASSTSLLYGGFSDYFPSISPSTASMRSSPGRKLSPGTSSLSDVSIIELEQKSPKSFSSNSSNTPSRRRHTAPVTMSTSPNTVDTASLKPSRKPGEDSHVSYANNSMREDPVCDRRIVVRGGTSGNSDYGDRFCNNSTKQECRHSCHRPVVYDNIEHWRFHQQWPFQRRGHSSSSSEDGHYRSRSKDSLGYKSPSPPPTSPQNNHNTQ